MYIHDYVSVSKSIDNLEKLILNKQNKLNSLYPYFKHNLLGINIPDSFFLFKEEKIIADFLNSYFYNQIIAKTYNRHFDIIYFVFYDAVFQIDLNKKETQHIQIDKAFVEKKMQNQK